MAPIGAARANLSRVPSFIPDAIDYHWPQDAGSGTTATAAIGNVDLDIVNGGNWTDRSAFSEGTAPLLDGSDDYEITKSNIDINGPQATLAGWFYDLDPSGDFNPAIFATQSDPENQMDNGYQLVLNDATNLWRAGAYDNGYSGDAFNTSGPDAANSDLFIALSADGDTIRARIYDDQAIKVFDKSGTSARGQTSSEPLIIGARDSYYISGNPDDIFVSTDSVLSDSELEELASVPPR